MAGTCMVLALGAAHAQSGLDLVREFNSTRASILSAAHAVRSTDWLAQGAFVTEYGVNNTNASLLLGQHRPFVLHISAHADESGNIHFVQDGHTVRMPPSLLVSVLRVSRRDGYPTMVVLNACCTANLAHRLLNEANVPIVVGTTGVMPDRLAMIFSPIFYAHLAQHADVQNAFNIACAYVEAAAQPEDEGIIISVGDDTSAYVLEPQDLAAKTHIPPDGGCGTPPLPPPVRQRLQDILDRARKPLTFCQYWYTALITNARVLATGVRFELDKVPQNIVRFGEELVEFEKQTPRPTVSDTAMYFVNHYRGATGDMVGPCLFAVDAGSVWYEDKGKWHKYNSASLCGSPTNNDPAPWAAWAAANQH